MKNVKKIRKILTLNAEIIRALETQKLVDVIGGGSLGCGSGVRKSLCAEGCQ